MASRRVTSINDDTVRDPIKPGEEWGTCGLIGIETFPGPTEGFIDGLFSTLLA